jgi:hypothetical protein
VSAFTSFFCGAGTRACRVETRLDTRLPRHNVEETMFGPGAVAMRRLQVHQLQHELIA